MKNISFPSYSEKDIPILSVEGYWHSVNHKRWKCSPYFVNNSYLYLILDGSFVAHINNQIFYVKKGDIMYIPANSEYSARAMSDIFSYKCVWFTLADNSSYTKPFVQHINITEKFSALFSSINNELLEKSIGHKMKAKMFLYDIFRNLLIEELMSTESFSAYYTLRNAINYINQNYTKKSISINELSKMCNITPTHFTRLFRQLFFSTPKKYIADLKISYASDLLQYSDCSIKEIAEMLDYSSSANFCTAFKKHTKMNPMEYRLKYNPFPL